MKLRDAIARLDRSDGNKEYVGESFFNVMGFPAGQYHEAADEVLKHFTCYWMIRWNCTDTWVGARLYFFDGEFLAMSTQPARRCSEEFRFASDDVYRRAHALMSTLLVEPVPSADLCDLDEEVGEDYVIDYYNGVIDTKAFYNGVPVEIAREESRAAREKLSGLSSYLYKNAVIRIPGGMTQEVPLSDLRFPYRLTA